ncbi:MAG: rhodanese-like domain-containing protein [Candidatus Aminicenantales bacterium]
MELKKTILEIGLIVGLSSVLGIGMNFSLLMRNLKGEFTESFLFSNTEDGMTFIGLGEAEDLFARGEALFIDSRSREKFKSGHILGAQNLPFETDRGGQPGRLDIPTDQTVIVYCDGGECQTSVGLAKILHLRGFKDIRIFTGGWNEWRNAGLPVASGNDPQ